MSTIRVGIAGTGFFGADHAQKFAAMADIKLSACFSRTAENNQAFARKHNIARAVSSFPDLLAECDLVVIATPDREHAAMAIAALDAGKHVLCEKPLTVTLEESREVVSAAHRARVRGQHHAVNHSKRNAPAVIRAMELVRTGQLGEIRHVHGSYLQAWLASNYIGPWSAQWLLWRLASDMGSGGALADLGAHLLDYTTAIGGEAKAMRCTLRTYPKFDEAGKQVTHHAGHALDANDSATIELDLAGGGLAALHTSRWGTGVANSERLDVHGTEGALSFDLALGPDRLQTCLGEDRHTNIWTTIGNLPPVPTVQQRLVTAIREGTPMDPDLVRGAQIQAMLDACTRSAATGKWEIPARFHHGFGCESR